MLALPTWNEAAQQVEILRTQPSAKRVKQDPNSQYKAEPIAFQPLPINREHTAATETSSSPTAISTHLLIPQKTPATPAGEVYFPKLSPAADIWLQALTWVVEGIQFERSGDIAPAIGRFQSARSAYQQVESRFPDWQPEIIAFRIDDLQQKIRLLVEKTATAANSKTQSAAEKAP